MYTLLLLYGMKYLNSKEVSDIIGVNISTLKRWTDNGTINCHKTAGGHRKFTMQNVRDYYNSNKKASKSDNVSLENFEHKKIFELIKKGNYSELSYNLIKDFEEPKKKNNEILETIDKLGQKTLAETMSRINTFLRNEI